jgi:hypothetical protein
MEAVLYSLIRDYQKERNARLGTSTLTFRLGSIKAYATRHPEHYPEFVIDPDRIVRAVSLARNTGEILPPAGTARDDDLWIRWDHDSSSSR